MVPNNGEESIVKALSGPISVTTLLVSFGPYFSPYYFVYLITALIFIIFALQRVDHNRKQEASSKYKAIRSIIKPKTGALTNNISGSSSPNLKKGSDGKIDDKQRRRIFTSRSSSILTSSMEQNQKSDKNDVKSKFIVNKSTSKPMLKDLKKRFSKSFKSTEENINITPIKGRYYDGEQKVWTTIK